jgi:hypothetical protein
MNSVIAFVSGILLVTATAFIAIKSSALENFVNVPIIPIVFRDQQADDGEYEAIPDNYQSSLPPRASPVGYNAVMRDQRLSNFNPQLGAPFMAVPATPLDNREAVGVEESYVSPQQQVQQDDSVPVGRVPVSVYDKIRSVQSDRQVIFDRLVYSTGKSRNHGAGDPIRGDLSIVPQLPVADPNSPILFRPAASIDRDLRQGALQVIAGDNEVSKNLTKLKLQANPARRSYMVSPDGTIVTQKQQWLDGLGMGDINAQAFT